MKIAGLLRRVLVLLIVVGVTGGVSAQSLNTQRTLRNMDIALNLVISPAMKAGTIPPGKEFEASVLVKDLKERLPKAHADFDRIEAADKSQPSVVAMGKRLDELDQVLAKLGGSVGAQAKTSGDAKERHFAFMAELKKYEPTIVRFGQMTKDHERDIMGNAKPDVFKQWVDELKVVQTACATKYAGIQNHPTYSLGRLADSPGDWCQIAAQGDSYAHRAVLNHVQSIALRRIETLQELSKTPEKNNGYLTNWVVTAVSDPEGIKKALTDESKPWFTSIGLEMPAGFFAPVDKVVADAMAALDKSAAKWTYPEDRFHDARIEGVVRGQMAAGVKVMKTSMIADDWSISKNSLGVVTDRYRSGHILFRMPALKWCSLREFTYLESYAGGGKFQPASTATLSEAVRFQSCN